KLKKQLINVTYCCRLLTTRAIMAHTPHSKLWCAAEATWATIVSKCPEDAKTIRSQSVHSSPSVQRRFLRRRSDWTTAKSRRWKDWSGNSLDVRTETIPRAGYATLCGSLRVVADTQSAGTAFKTICMYHE